MNPSGLFPSGFSVKTVYIFLYPFARVTFPPISSSLPRTH